LKLDALTFAIAALACYRLTILISRDLGPWDILKKLRKIDKCSRFLSCVFCVSIWVGAFIALGLYLSGVRFALSDNITSPGWTWIPWAMLALSLSAITIMADRIFTSDHSPK
jgi:hypothetical protein